MNKTTINRNHSSGLEFISLETKSLDDTKGLLEHPKKTVWEIKFIIQFFVLSFSVYVHYSKIYTNKLYW